MAELSATEAYRAAIEDFQTVRKRTRSALRHKFIVPHQAEAYFREQLNRLYTDRMLKGELPPDFTPRVP